MESPTSWACTRREPVPAQSGVRVFSGVNGAVLIDQNTGTCACSLVAAFLADVNADGFDEVLVATTTPGFAGTGTVVVRKGPAGAVHATIYTGNVPSVADLGDVSGDGQPDIGFVEQSLGTNFKAFSVGSGGVIQNSGYLWFFLPPSFQGSGYLKFVGEAASLGDVNGDGRSDVAVSVSFLNPTTFHAYVTVFVLSGANGSILSWSFDQGEGSTSRPGPESSLERAISTATASPSTSTPGTDRSARVRRSSRP